MVDQQPQPGLVKLMDYLQSRGLRLALCTRNFEYVHRNHRCSNVVFNMLIDLQSRAPVKNLLENHLPAHVFLPIITRDTPNILPKPDPAGILHIASEWGLANGENLIMVGDSIDDMTSGHAAGAATVLLVNEHNRHLSEHPHTDLCISQLDDLVNVLEGGFLGTKENDDHAK
jgi:phosphoglycolate phosphatase-like HAD superfamily hydrolase